MCRSRQREAIVFFSPLLAVFLAAAPARATTIVRVPDEALVDQAAQIVVGEVVERPDTADAAAPGELSVRVERTLKGVEAGEVRVRLPGGASAAGVRRRIEGVPAFAPGQRVLLFLEPHPRGEWRLLHLAQGAFREAAAGGRRWAVRDLERVLELRRVNGSIEAGPAAGREPRRDFDAFADWIAARAAGEAAGAAYLAASPAGRPERVSGAFTLFTDPDDGTLLRWFVFDTGGSVPWRFFHTGQDGVAGGGSAELQTALAAWNAEPETPVDLRFAGTTTATGGLLVFDGLNVLLFGDPNDEITDLSPACSGTLAVGGAGYFTSPRLFHGTTYYAFIEGDIVVNDGLECFFGDSPDASKAAEELFAHELGHTLGIGHSEVRDALMRAFIHDDGRGASLHADDVAALRALYADPSAPPPPPPEPCDPATEICLLGDRFRVELTWVNDPPNPRTPPDWPAGGVAEVLAGFPAGSPSPDLVLLDLHDARTPEVVLKMIDATSFDGSFWVFASALTDVGFDLTITDTATGATKTYDKPQGSRDFAFADTDAFTGGGPFGSPATPRPAAAAIAPCAADALCLHGGRFEVRLTFTNHHDPSDTSEHTALPVPLTDTSGLFAFFDPDSPDLAVNLIDANAWSGAWWVHASGLTDLAWEMEIRDTETGATSLHRNLAGFILPLFEDAEFIAAPAVLEVPALGEAGAALLALLLLAAGWAMLRRTA